jgi:hypothetical protein
MNLNPCFTWLVGSESPQPPPPELLKYVAAMAVVAISVCGSLVLWVAGAAVTGSTNWEIGAGRAHDIPTNATHTLSRQPIQLRLESVREVPRLLDCEVVVAGSPAPPSSVANPGPAAVVVQAFSEPVKSALLSPLVPGPPSHTASQWVWAPMYDRGHVDVIAYDNDSHITAIINSDSPGQVSRLRSRDAQ